MRLWQLLENPTGDTPLGPNEIRAQTFAIDILSQWVDEKQKSIPAKALLQAIQGSPDADAGVELDNQFIIRILSGVDFIEKIEPDPENGGQMTIFFKDTFQGSPGMERSADPDKDKENIKKHAANVAKKRVKNED